MNLFPKMLCSLISISSKHGTIKSLFLFLQISFITFKAFSSWLYAQTTDPFSLIVPHFSKAICSIVSPRIAVWSRESDVITFTSGVSITFVASSLPPKPTSKTRTSTLSLAKQRTMFGSTSCNSVSRFINEIPKELLEGYEEAFESSKKQEYRDTSYKWEYGGNSFNSNTVKTYNIGNSEKIGVAAKSTTGYAFRTAESFLNNLNKKQETNEVIQYEAGQRVYHKKFGEGIINYVEEEGQDYKVDITFDKAGHKRLMAKFAGLEII